MTRMLDEFVLARMMITQDLKFERPLHYHNEGYEGNNDYGFLTQIKRPIHIYFLSTTEASLDPADFTKA